MKEFGISEQGESSKYIPPKGRSRISTSHRHRKAISSQDEPLVKVREIASRTINVESSVMDKKKSSKSIVKE
jgi:hypothetical protein